MKRSRDDHVPMPVGIVLLAALAITALTSASCASSPDSKAIAPVNLLDQRTFVSEGVNDFLERRCGTLDCHGNIARPLRVYSATGLRKTDPTKVGVPRPAGATTDDEKLDNYLSVVGLEPEALTVSGVTGGQYADYMLLKKPLGVEGGGVRHKGGPVLRVNGDPGFRCLDMWIQGKPDKAACTDAVVNY